jgi:hypothetical protein
VTRNRRSRGRKERGPEPEPKDENNKKHNTIEEQDVNKHWYRTVQERKRRREVLTRLRQLGKFEIDSLEDVVLFVFN